MQQVGIYLAGAMRATPDEERYDRAWRDVVTKEMERYSSNVVIFNPMDGKIVHEGETKLFDKFRPEPNAILHQDMASIAKSNIVFMNLIPLDAGPLKYHLQMPSRFTLDRESIVVEGRMEGSYPHIGTLSEMGMSIITHKLLVVISKNPYVAKHPFVRGGATRILPTLEDGIEYLQGLVGVLSGSDIKE
jgi:hypothetical protein